MPVSLEEIKTDTEIVFFYVAPVHAYLDGRGGREGRYVYIVLNFSFVWIVHV